MKLKTLSSLRLLLALLPGAFMLIGMPACAEEANEERLLELERHVQEMQEQREQSGSPNIHLGGYGEMHYNVVEGPAKDMADLHRFVLYLGYDFAEWARLHSEVEIEHAFIEEGNGELSIEQAFIELDGSEQLNGRIGRVLVPLGIINQRHEPTTFNGVERPLVDNVIIPTTWMADGAGLHGGFGDKVKYQAYLTNSLDGTNFSALEGIRGGRMKERPGLSQLAISGRVDFFPFADKELDTPRNLRLGAAFFGGGVGNANKGAANPIDASVNMSAVDAEYSVGKFDLRGVWALGQIDGALAIGNNVAEKIMGWYLEGAIHVLPDGWKQGKLRNADAVIFVRYDKADTQHKMPAGVTPNLAGDRTETTFGISFYPTGNLVLKADYQIKDNAGATDPANQFNLGAGWAF